MNQPPTPARRSHTPTPDSLVDEHLRLLARALIDTAVQVREEALAAGPLPADCAAAAAKPARLDPGAASRYPPTPRDCGPVQRRRRRSRSERFRSPSDRTEASNE